MVKLDTDGRSNSEVTVSDLMEPCDGPRLDATVAPTPDFGSQADVIRVRTTTILCESLTQEVLGPGEIIEPIQPEYPRWPNFVTLAVKPSSVLPGMVLSMPIPMHHSVLPASMHRKKQAANRSPCWTVESKEMVIFDDGELCKSLQFVDSAFGEAYPIDCFCVAP